MAASVKHLDASGALQISSKNFADILAGASNTPQKFFVENNGDRTLDGLIASIAAIGANDGFNQVRFATDPDTVGTPFNFVGVLSGPGAGGVFASAVLHSYRITATNATGETTGAIEISVDVDDVTKKVTLTWTQPTGATGYRIYRTTTAGSYVSPALLTIIANGGTTQFTDDGSAVTAGALPTENTTAGAGPAFGTPPTLGASPLAIGEFEIGEQFIYWIGLVVPAGTSELGNPRQAQIEFDES